MLHSFAASLLLLTGSPAVLSADPPPVPQPAAAPMRTLIQFVDLGAPAATVFAGFTTNEGITKHWSVAKAKVDFRIGGQIRTCYQPDGDVDAPTAIVNTILAYEPDRMLTIKATAPEGSPSWLQKICQAGWSVLRLEPTGPDRCRLTLTGCGYPAAGVDPELDQAYAFFEKGNRWTLDKLAALYPLPDAAGPDANASPDTSPTAGAATDSLAARTIDLSRFVARGVVPVDLHKESIVNATPEQIFPLWTTREGFKQFLSVESNVDLAIGGPIELHFGPNLPPGQKGSDGCQYLSYLPNRMISFSWNAPPKFPVEREKRTWIVITLTPIDAEKTKVEFDHLGFGPKGEGHWDEVRSYFDRAWTHVLAALVKHFSEPAAD